MMMMMVAAIICHLPSIYQALYQELCHLIQSPAFVYSTFLKMNVLKLRFWGLREWFYFQNATQSYNIHQNS